MSWQSGKTGTAAAGSIRRTGVRPLVIVATIVFSLAILANGMIKELSRDEHMYCTAGALMAQGKMIYEDFAYPSQLPYHPLLLAALYRGLGTTHYLLVGRLVSVACAILTILLILGIYRSAFGTRRTEGLLFGLAGIILYLFNPLVDYAIGYAWNHDVVILCVVASVWLYATTDFAVKSRYWRVAAIGVLLTFATFMRVTTAMVELVFLAMILLSAGGSIRNRCLTALPFSLAALIVAAWPLWIIARAPQAFYLNLIHIPSLYGRWLHEIGTTFDKLALTIVSLTTPGYLVLLVLTGCLAWTTLRRRSSLDTGERRNIVLPTALALIFLIIAYIPPTMWQQYLAVPVPFLVIAFAYPLAAMGHPVGWAVPTTSSRTRTVGGHSPPYTVAAWLMAVGAIVAIIANPVVLYRTLAVVIPEGWTPLTLHKVARDIAERVEEPQLVLTLGPLYALEGGCDIYPELAAGDIIYRAADLMTPAERRITHTVGPETLDELVAVRPPSAVIAGIEPSYFSFLEDPLRRAVPPNWPRQTYNDRLQVYTRP